MSWTWRLENEDGIALSAPFSPVHPSQSDAENWIGETWRELAEQGVAQATLLKDGEVEYGPMSLGEA